MLHLLVDTTISQKQDRFFVEKSKIKLEFLTEILRILLSNQKYRKKGLWKIGDFPVGYYNEMLFFIGYSLISQL